MINHTTLRGLLTIMVLGAVIPSTGSAAKHPAEKSATRAASKTPATHVLPFIEDDYPRALAEARARKLPLFIEVSAPWCHSCRWMEAFVFTDKSLAPQAGRFVWLAINGELAVNASLVKDRLNLAAYPTLYVMDPKDQRIALSWVGAANKDRLLALLDEAAAAVASGSVVRHDAGDSPGSAAADTALARADRAYGEGHYPEAAGAYGQALALAPAGWNTYSRVVESRLFALQMSDSNDAVLRLSEDSWGRLQSTPSSANVASSGLGAALALPAGAADRTARVARWEDACRAVLAGSAVTNSDDRSAVYSSLVDARRDARDSTAAQKWCEEWVAYLDGQAAHAAGSEQRTALDPDRLGAMMELGKPELAIPMLEASQRDFPDDYNPPARLANVYRMLKQWDKALAASDRAMKLSYGPRKVNFYRTRVDIQLGTADTTGARTTLHEGIQFIQSLPPQQQSKLVIAALQKRLDELSVPRP